MRHCLLAHRTRGQPVFARHPRGHRHATANLTACLSWPPHRNWCLRMASVNLSARRLAIGVAGASSRDSSSTWRTSDIAVPV